MFGPQTEASRQTGRIRIAAFLKRFRRADPEQRRDMRLLARDEGCNRQGETGRKAGVAAFVCMDFGQRRARKAAAQRLVEPCCAGWQEGLFGTDISPRPDHNTARRDIGPVQRFRRPPFDLRDLMTQSANGVPRHGVGRHDGPIPAGLFLLCSY